MKTDKKIFICVLLALMVLLCINGVSAQDTIDKNLTVSDTSEGVIGDDSSQGALEVSDSGEKLSAEHEVNNYNELVTACTDAADGDTIVLNDGTYEFPDSSGSIYLTSSTGSGNYAKSLTFKGQTKGGVTITSPGNYAIFQATDSYNLKLQNLNFKDVTVSSSNVVFTSGSGNLDIVDCTFEDCKLGWGTIRSSSTGVITISGVNILNCEQTANQNAATALTFTGASTVNVENVLIDSPKYSLTTAKAKGVIYVSNNAAQATFDDVTIKNSTGIKTSLIYCSGTVSIKNSNIVDNTVESTKIIHNAGTLTIEQTIFSNNTATGSNSALFSDIGSTSVKSKLTLNYNNIADNTVTNIYSFNDAEKVETATANYNYWGTNYDDADALKSATNIEQTNWANKNGETFVDQSGNPLAKTIPTPYVAPQIGDVYVSAEGNDVNDGSSADNAVQSIKHAIELAESGNGKIYVIAGEYTITEKLTSAKSLDIECEVGMANITSNLDVMFENTAGLKLTNLNFTSTATGNGAIINNGADLTVDKCIFNVNTETGNAIYVTAGEVNIANSILLNPNGNSLVKSGDLATITANNNWWGVNTTPNDIAEKWIVMDVSLTANNKIAAGDEITVAVSFEKLNDGSAYEGRLPNFDVQLTSTSVDLESQTLAISNNKNSISYTANTDNTITISSGSTTITIPVKIYVAPDVIYVATNGKDENDGDSEHPLKTIDEAILTAQNGKIVIREGTYEITNTLVVDKNLDISGEGTVIIDGNSKRFLTNNADLNISNVQFTNGFDNGGVIYNYGNLTLNNILVYSNIINSRPNAAIINNNKKVIIDNSKFYQNNASYGNVYNNGGEVLINNTEFYNNGLTDDENTLYGIGLYSRYGNAVVENTKFYQNEGMFSVINFVGKSSLDSSEVNILTVNNCTFENNQLVRYGVIYSEKSNIDIKDSTFTNNVVKKSTIANGEGGAIYVNGGNANVETSVFINNDADDLGKDIYVSSGELIISGSVLINNNGNSIEKSDSANVTADNNWWGANAPNTPVTVDKWIVMTVTCNDSSIEIGDEITITASFDKTNDGADYTSGLPEVIDVTFTSDSGNLNEVKTIKDKKAEVTYTVDAADRLLTVASGDASDSLKVDIILDVIYVSEDGNDTYDGNRSTPVASLSKAVELARRGKIVVLPGTYKTGDLGIISDDLNITGEGKVIIDADNSNRIFYIYNTSNVILKNLILVNGYTNSQADESGALLGNAGNLTLINCTLANSKSEKNAGAVYNAGNLYVIDSTFENNTADKCGGAIFTQSAGIGIIPSLTVSNSIFKNNTANGDSKYDGGAIYVQSASSVSIADSLFENNRATQYGGGAIEITLTETATIDNTKFIKNTAVGEDYKDKSDYGGGAISFIGSYGDLKETLTITNSLFIDNSVTECGGGAIYARYSKVNIAGSVLINNNDANNVSVYRRTTDINTAKITADDNWWGSNDSPKSLTNGATISRWAILTVSNASEIKAGETVTLTVELSQYTTGSENGTMANPIKVERPVTLYTNLGNIEGTLVDGKYTNDYTVPDDLKIISAIVDDETQQVYVIPTKTILALENITGSMGDRVEYTINVTSDDGSVVTCGNVELYFAETLVKTIPVVNGQAKGTVIINKETGNYTIAAKFIDETSEFSNSDATATLTVKGINNVVTPETFSQFFDSEGVLLSDIPFDEIFFEGTFDDVGVITVNKPIKITGRNAQLNDVAFKILADNVELNALNITSTQSFDETDGAVIYVGGNNVTISNNGIEYNAPENVQSYVISVDIADNVEITKNNIKYSAESEGDVKTIAVNVVSGNNLVFEDNTLDASIPSVPIGYSNWPQTDYYSQAVHIENSNNVSFKNNKIDVDSSNAYGSYDTIYAVHITSSDDAVVSGNDIDLTAPDSGYGLVMDGKNLKISNNAIDVESDDYYAAGVNINDASTAVLDGNNISATSKQVSYPVYLDDWGMGSEINLTNNNIKGDSNTVYGVYVEGNKSTISNNNIDVQGNFTMAIVAYETDLVIDSNDIVSNGTNIGTSLSPQSSVPVETTGICVSKGDVTIKNNKVVSSTNSTINAINTTGSIEGNDLVVPEEVNNDTNPSANNTDVDNNQTSTNTTNNTANNETNNATNTTTGNVTDNSTGNVTDVPDKPADNTTVEPTKTVTKTVKLSAKNVSMYYSYSTKYKVRVTVNGKVAKGVKVKITVNGKTKTVKTDKKGYATLTIKNSKLKPKKYTITAKYGGKVVKSKLTVKQILKSSNKKVKKSAKKFVLTATLKKGKKAIKGKKITFKFNGKTYKAKTNKKGVAKVTIKKNVIKKLKVGKKYTFKVTYLKDSIKKTVKVRK